MAKASFSADSAFRLDPHPSPTVPSRRLPRDMSARSRVRVQAQV